MDRADPARHALDAVDRIMDVHDEQSLITEVQAAIAPFGLQWFVIAGIPEPFAASNGRCRVAAWPPGWFERYMKAGYYGVDPIARHARRTAEPFTWSEASWDPTQEPSARNMMADACAHGLCQGFTVPILAASGEQEVVSFAASSSELSAQDRNVLRLIAIYAHHRAYTFASSQVSADPPGRITQ